MRISDWSSDVCSSDLPQSRRGVVHAAEQEQHADQHQEQRRLRPLAQLGERTVELRIAHVEILLMRSSISENARLKNQLMRADDAATSPEHPNTATSTSVLTALLVTSRYPAYSNRRNETAVSTRDRKDVVEGKSGSVRVTLGGPRTIKKK